MFDQPAISTLNSITLFPLPNGEHRVSDMTRTIDPFPTPSMRTELREIGKMPTGGDVSTGGEPSSGGRRERANKWQRGARDAVTNNGAVKACTHGFIQLVGVSQSGDRSGWQVLELKGKTDLTVLPIVSLTEEKERKKEREKERKKKVGSCMQSHQRGTFSCHLPLSIELGG